EGKPNAPKKRVDSARSLTGRLTAILVAIGRSFSVGEDARCSLKHCFSDGASDFAFTLCVWAPMLQCVALGKAPAGACGPILSPRAFPRRRRMPRTPACPARRYRFRTGWAVICYFSRRGGSRERLGAWYKTRRSSPGPLRAICHRAEAPGGAVSRAAPPLRGGRLSPPAAQSTWLCPP